MLTTCGLYTQGGNARGSPRSFFWGGEGVGGWTPKSTKNEFKHHSGTRVGNVRQSGAQGLQNGAEIAQRRSLGTPGAPSTPIFSKTVDLHETLLYVDGLHVQGARAAPLRRCLGSKRRPRILKGVVPTNCQKK